MNITGDDAKLEVEIINDFFFFKMPHYAIPNLILFIPVSATVTHSAGHQFGYVL